MTIGGCIRHKDHISFAVTVPHKKMFEGKELEMFDIRCLLFITAPQAAALAVLPEDTRRAQIMEMASWAAIFVRERMKKYIAGFHERRPDDALLLDLDEDVVKALKDTFGSPIGDFECMKFNRNGELSIIGMAAIFGEETENVLPYGETDKARAN